MLIETLVNVSCPVSVYSNAAACKLLRTHKYHHYNSIWVYGNSAPVNCMLDPTPCTTAYGDRHTFKRKRSCNITFWDLFSIVVTQPNILRCVIKNQLITSYTSQNVIRADVVQSPCLAIFGMTFFFAVVWVATAHFVHVSLKSVCTFTVF